MRKILQYLVLMLAAVLVFGTAKLLDNAPWRAVAPELQRQPETAAVETLPEETEPVQTETQTTTGKEEERFLITFAGNCALGCRDAHAYAGHGFRQTIGQDYGFPFRNVVPYFENDELTLLALEGVFYDEGWQQDTASLRGPSDYVNILTQGSVEAVSLASEHALDYGELGYASTVAALQNAGIDYVQRDGAVVITTENGLTVGIYGGMYYSPETETVAQAIRELDAQVDLVIFAPHWSFSMDGIPSQEQVEMAHEAVDAGADIVWGSHPYVLQTMETYKNAVICYSLGNFSFGGDLDPKDYDAALIRQEVIRSADGSVALGETTVVPVSVSSVSDRNNYQPTPYEEGSEDYVRVLGKLAFTGKN